jgi:ATP-binding cassette, subfamily C (CFTR/MRP), member 1
VWSARECFHRIFSHPTQCSTPHAVIIIMMPVTKAVAKWMGSMQRALMAAKDKRVEVNCEVLGSMKVIKLQAWEESFENRILALRELELKQLWRYVICNSLSIMLWSATPLAVALATFAAYIWSGHKLEVASALTSLALFDILRFPLFMLPQVINNIVEAGVSMERIRSFLLCDEYTPIPRGDLNGKGIRVENASFAYESKKPKPRGVDLDPAAKELADHQWEITLLKSQLQEAENRIKELVNKDDSVEKVEMTDGEFQSANLLCLKRINFECKEGELIAIIGGVGCGKSSFINAILGEVRSLCGRTLVNGSLSYFAQTPFIMNDTVKSNILFGHTDEHVDEERYQRALDSCALRQDLELLPAGDQTEIGEKGITLSGGQKARVSLARAVYHSADICLLDDPLAAVDAHVGKHLFQKCIIDQLLLCKGETQTEDTPKKKTVVLVTNALQYLSNPRVDRILVVRDGRVVEQGSYTELSKSDSLFAKFLAVMAETGVSPTTTEGCNVDTVSSQPVAGGESVDVAFSVDNEPVVGEIAIAVKDEQTGAPKPSGALMTDEIKERESGHVDMKIYAAWGKAAGGIWAPFAIIFTYAFVEFINVLSKWWLTYWSEHAGTESQVKFLMVYALINLASIASTLLRLILLMVCGLRASRELFVRLLTVILHAPMAFFDTTPAGRIINRFSKGESKLKGDPFLVDLFPFLALPSFSQFFFKLSLYRYVHSRREHCIDTQKLFGYSVFRLQYHRRHIRYHAHFHRVFGANSCVLLIAAGLFHDNLQRTKAS